MWISRGLSYHAFEILQVVECVIIWQPMSLFSYHSNFSRCGVRQRALTCAVLLMCSRLTMGAAFAQVDRSASAELHQHVSADTDVGQNQHASTKQHRERHESVSTKQDVERNESVSAKPYVERNESVSAKHAGEPRDVVSSEGGAENDHGVSVQHDAKSTSDASAKQQFERNGSVSAERSVESNDVALDPAASAIDALNDKILLREIDFARFSTQYKMVGTEEPRSRHLRYFLWQEAAAALFLSSPTVALATTADGLKNPNRVSSLAGKHSTYQGLVASFLEGGSSGFELGSNMLLTAKHKRLKQDPRSAMSEAVTRLREIDQLCTQRKILLDQYAGPLKASFDAESEVQKLFRNWCAYDFADIFSDVKAFQASNNVYYALDVIGCSVFVASYLLGLEGYSKANFNGPSSVVGIVGDGIFIPSAPLSTFAYKKLYSRWWTRFEKQVGGEIVDPGEQAKVAIEKFEQLLKGDPNYVHEVHKAAVHRLNLRLQVYGFWTEHNRDVAEKREIDLRRMARVSKQSDISGPAISAGYLVADILGVNAAYHLGNNDKASNSNAFAGLIPSVAASAASLGLTTAWFIGDEREKKALKKAHALPSQLNADRLAALERFEKHLAQHQ